MEDILVFDDLFSSKQEDFYYTSIFGDDENKISPIIDFKIKREDTAKQDGLEPVSFKHILKSDPELSPHLENFSSIPVTVCEKLNLYLKTIFYARIFLTVPYKTQREYNNPHTDMSYPHYVVLYYVNDADGDTVFFDNNNNIITNVTPKKGRVVFFNGSVLHSGGVPKSGPRCVVNFDILI